MKINEKLDQMVELVFIDIPFASGTVVINQYNCTSFGHVISNAHDDCHLDSWCIRFWSKLPPECRLLRIIEINFIKSVAVDYVPSIKSNLGQIDAPDVNGRNLNSHTYTYLECFYYFYFIFNFYFIYNLQYLIILFRCFLFVLFQSLFQRHA